MCLGIPMELVEVNGNDGVAILSGVKREVRLDLVPDAKVGDFVIVHAGYAIQILSKEDAEETLKLLDELYTEEELEEGL